MKYQDYVAEKMKDPEFREAYNALEIPYQRLRKLIKYEIENPITRGMKSRKNRAKKLGISVDVLDKIDGMEDIDKNTALYIDLLLSNY